MRVLLFSRFIPISSLSARYKGNIGSLQFNKQFEINLDWDVWLNLSRQKGSFTYVKERLFIHRIHEEAESMKGILDERRLREDKMMLENIWPNGIHQIMSTIYSLSRRGW